MSDLSSDIVIIGAGVLGLAVAADLQARGADVRVVDPGGANASAIAAGMIAPAFESLLDQADAARAALLSRRRPVARVFQDAWPEAGSRPAVWKGPDPGGVAARLGALGFRAEMTADGVAAPDDVRIDPAEALGRLLAGLAARTTRGSALSVLRSGDAWSVQTTADTLRCRTIIVATGAAGTVPGLPTPAARATDVIRPIAGQIGFVAHRLADRVLRGPGGYVVPAEAGALIGATMVEGQSPARVDPAASARLIAMAERLLGHPIAAPVDWRAAVRAASPDGLPLAGSTGQGVHLALAPRRNGWLLAPLVARVVADGIEGRPCGTHAAALDPLRFDVSPPED